MKLSGCLLGCAAVIIFCILLLLIFLRAGIIKFTTYYDGKYYREKCKNSKYFITPDFIQPETQGYNLDLAKYLMQISYNVEASNCLNLGPIPPPAGFSLQKQLVGKSYDGNSRPFGYIFASIDAVLIAFTGTVFTDEWLVDLEIEQTFPEKLKNVKQGVLCHKGIYDVYASLQNQINVSETKKIYITGHSLGAALATLCAFDIAASKPVLYTFSSPRVFNITGAQLMNSFGLDIQRIFNTEDIFTSLPMPAALGENYEHVGYNIPFTINLDSIPGNHTGAYLKFLDL